MQERRWVASALAFLLGATALLIAPVLLAPSASADPPPGGTTIVSETFTGASVADPAWTVQNDTCLTGATSAPPAGAAQIPTCAGHTSGPVPAPGTPGYLQLTDTTGNARGSVLYNRPVPATAGVSITFDQFQYGGNGADGIGFFLVDGSTSLTSAGGNGGSLGYAQISNGAGTQAGIAGGILGVGLDAYGNYYDDGETRGTGCPAGQRSPSTATGPVAPNVITLRGPGSGATGYCYLASTTPANPANVNKPGTTLNGGSGTLRAATLLGSWRQVNIQVTPAPSPRVIVQVRYNPGTAGDPWITELNVLAPPNLPSTYKFGLSASTGGSNDVHLIRNALVQSINPLSNLQLVKQVDRTGAALPAVITAGTVIPYQFTVTNAGLEPLTSLAIQDTKITGPITCDRTSLSVAPAAGSTAVCKGSYTVTAADVSASPAQVVNTATATARDPVNSTITSNLSTVIVPLVSSLSLTKRVVTPGPYVDGKQVSYAYTITNTGGSTVTNISVTDNKIATANILCQTNTLAPGASTTCTGTYIVDSKAANTSGPLTGNIVNVATATGQTPIGQNVVSNQAQAAIPVNTDIAITKTVDNAAPTIGGTVVFTVTATNGGPAPATNVVITDQLPTGRLTYISSTTSGPQSSTYNATVGAWTIPALAVGNTITLTLTARVDTNTAVANSATLASLTQTDTNPANNSASVTVNPFTPSLDLAVTKQVVGDTTIPAGNQASFQVTVKNNGPSAGTGITINDPLPVGLTYDAAASGGDGSYDAVTGVWTVGSLAVGAHATFTFVVTTTGTGTFTNIATLDNVSPTDTNQANNSANAAIVVRAPIADLSIVKGVFPQTAVVGDTVTYQVSVLNHGPDTVQDVYVDDVGPGGITILNATATQGTIDAAAHRWTIGTLASGDSVQATITARLDTAGTKVNVVTVDAPLLSDPTPDNNQSTATLTTLAPAVDIGVTKTAAVVGRGNLASVPLGGQVEFTITATNNPVGGQPATTGTNVVFADVLEPGLTFVSSTGDGTFDAATGTWTVASIPVGTTVTRTILVSADAVGQHTNTLSLASLDQRDTDPTNNSDSATASVFELADLAITKTVSPDVAQPGDTVTYTVQVTNHGPNATDDTHVVDPAPIAADVTGHTVSTGTFDETTHAWDIPHLDNGETATLTFTVLLNPTASGPYTNVIAIQDSRVTDPNPDNNVADATLFVPVADILVAKAVSDPTPFVGDQITYTVQVTNLGPDQATDVTVNDVLPAGLTYISSTTTIGTYDPATGIWNVGTLEPKDPRRSVVQGTLSITARVDTTGTITNTATSDRTGANPYDPELANNTANAAIDATPAPANLVITKTASPGSLIVGASTVFTLTVTNSGAADAADTTVRDELPPTLTPTAVSDNRCTINGQVVLCHLGTLPAGHSVAIRVTATATTPGVSANTATAATTTPETTLADNAATTEVTAAAPPNGGGNGAVVAGEEISNGGLPRTGTNPSTALGLAALCLIGGSILVAATRPRKRQTQHPGIK